MSMFTLIIFFFTKSLLFNYLVMILKFKVSHSTQNGITMNFFLLIHTNWLLFSKIAIEIFSEASVDFKNVKILEIEVKVATPRADKFARIISSFSDNVAISTGNHQAKEIFLQNTS